MLVLLSLFTMVHSVIFICVPNLFIEGDVDGFYCDGWFAGWMQWVGGLRPIFVVMWMDLPRIKLQLC